MIRMLVLLLCNTFRLEYSLFSSQCDVVLISYVCRCVSSYFLPGIFLTCMLNTFCWRQDSCLRPILCSSAWSSWRIRNTSCDRSAQNDRTCYRTSCMLSGCPLRGAVSSTGDNEQIHSTFTLSPPPSPLKSRTRLCFRISHGTALYTV
jgi:hypothetical protein